MNKSAWNQTWFWTGLGGSWIWKMVLELEQQQQGFKSEKNQPGSSNLQRTSKFFLKNQNPNWRFSNLFIYFFKKTKNYTTPNTTLLQIKWVPGKFLIEQNKIKYSSFKVSLFFLAQIYLEFVLHGTFSVQVGERVRALNPKPNFRIFLYKKGRVPKNTPLDKTIRH
jgi:hypothetical protein